MTDQTIPAGLTRDEANAARSWAERALAAEVQDGTVVDVARVLLAVLPRPTLADMTPEERRASRWMQCDHGIPGRYRSRGVIGYFDYEGEKAVILTTTCGVQRRDYAHVTPRPDLPRLTWPGDKKPTPAPALPDGWRLADHREHGRVIVTNPTPDRNGNVPYMFPSDDSPLRRTWHFAFPDALTYLDQEDCPPRDQLTQGAKWHDIAKLEEALRQKGEAADQAIVIDDEGDAHVWETAGGGRWMVRIPIQQCGPFRVILNEQEADQ